MFSLSTSLFDQSKHYFVYLFDSAVHFFSPSSSSSFSLFLQLFCLIRLDTIRFVWCSHAEWRRLGGISFVFFDFYNFNLHFIQTTLSFEWAMFACLAHCLAISLSSLWIGIRTKSIVVRNPCANAAMRILRKIDLRKQSESLRSCPYNNCKNIVVSIWDRNW